jgi:3-deoxy-manno-octulosonate cytidylyltransferase (CMP-KDO synthetase)
MSAAVIIPARYASSRFPGKALALLNGKPLVQHVYERASESTLADEVLVATDSREILDAVASFGGRAVMTSPEHATGTDRIAEAAAGTGYDIIVNVQGDEPLIRPDIVDTAIRLLDDEKASIGTIAVRVSGVEDIIDPNVVKVAIDERGYALYFSRSPIPYHRDAWKSLAGITNGGTSVLKHVGIYSFRQGDLLRFTSLPPAALEQTEKLEQLRALENGMVIKVAIEEYETMGVDTPEDLERVRKCLSTSS